MIAPQDTRLSPGEEEAERIYYAAVSHTLTFGAAVALAKHLERESPLGGAYLRWLLMRRREPWPAVAGGGTAAMGDPEE